MIAKHLPAIQLLLPFCAALLSVLTFSEKAAYVVALLGALAGFAVSVYGYQLVKATTINYAFGGWQAPIGIEYSLDELNQPIIIYLNFVLVTLLLFGKRLIENNVLSSVNPKWSYLFYPMLLFAHSGYIGITSTHDLFNLYVFIEISSLAAYVLMSQGKDRRALIGAFDYLVLGTIGATLILIGIGFLLAITGSLNMTDIGNILAIAAPSRLVVVAIVFFLTGAILKMAFFPMHFWMIRAYSGASPIILSYLSAISGIIGAYILLRFVHFTLDYSIIQAYIAAICKPIALITIITCSYLAMRAKSLQHIIVYSSATQVGYVFLLMSIIDARWLLFQLLFFDSMNKITLFNILAHMQTFKIKSLTTHQTSFKALVALALFFSAGLPVSGMFFVKINMLEMLINKNMLLELVLVLVGSVFAILYHIKMGKSIFLPQDSARAVRITTPYYGLYFLVICQFVLLFDLTSIIRLFEKIGNSIL